MDAMEAAEQIAALEGFATDNADIERLKELLVETDTAVLKALRNFANLAANNPDFEKLKELHRKWSAEFDAIAFLELSRNERCHSRFLAWLLNPEENHGTGAYFLENFLWKILEQAKALGIGKADSPEMDEAIWTQTSVTPEWPHEVDGKRGFLDILLVNPKEKFLCAIENKVDTGEHSGQLGRYRKALEKNYPDDFTRCYVFLSPGGKPPEQEEDQGHWTPVTYATILELVEDTLKATDMRGDVRVFLQQYVRTLRRNIVDKHSDEVRQLARKIYLENREVIELTYEYKPNYLAEMREIIRNVVRGQPGWILDKEQKDIIRFRPDTWTLLPGFLTGTGWPPSEALLLFEFTFDHRGTLDHRGNTRMVLCLGPSENESIRQEIFEKINNVDPNRFKHAAYPLMANQLNTSYTHIYSGENILDEKDFGKWDDNEGSYIREKVKRWVEDFAQKDFPTLNDIIVDCFREYEARQADSSVASSHGDVSA